MHIVQAAEKIARTFCSLVALSNEKRIYHTCINRIVGSIFKLILQLFNYSTFKIYKLKLQFFNYSTIQVSIQDRVRVPRKRDQ
jgi:hypothetical protein